MLLTSLVASLGFVSAAVAQTPDEEARVKAVLSQLSAGQDIGVSMTQRNSNSRELVAADVAEAKAKARDCMLDQYSIVKTITHEQGLSVIAVNLKCAGSTRYGLLFSFQDGQLNGVELRPGGILFVPPPPPAFRPQPSGAN